MIERKTVIRKTTRKIYICDECGKSSGTPGVRCDMCKKDVCGKCCVEIWSTGDIPERFCPTCWNAGDTYRIQISELESKIDDVYGAWMDAAEAGNLKSKQESK